MTSTPLIFHNFLAVKDQPATFVVDDLYIATSGELYRRFDGLRPSLKSCKKEPGPGDLISRLPDDILLAILSRLSTEEAVKTSVLSTRWATLWWHAPKLCFCGISRMVRGEFVIEESSNFISRVNRVLQLHQAPVLDEFCVHVDYRYFPVDSSKISAWVYFALSRRVKRLELDFLKFSGSNEVRAHVFGFWISSVDSSRIALTKQYLDYCNDFTSVKEVSLGGLDVSSSVIEYLLLKCGCLERLTVICAKKLDNLVVSSSSLRYLNITYVDEYLKSVEIRSCPNLTTLILENKGRVKLMDIPRVIELQVYVQLSPCRPLRKGMFKHHLSQLEVLMIHSFNLQAIQKLGRVPELSKLKTLIINMGVWGDDSLIGLTSLVAASPNLRKFMLQLYWAPGRARRELKRMNRPLNLEHLKVVEVSGYYGCTCEDELIMYLLENAVAAEKLILNPRNGSPLTIIPKLSDMSLVHDIVEDEKSRVYARQLQELVPNHVEVIIL